MSGVIIRCPGCGTTQAQVGECDACYESQVRYFCANHSPGLWLDESQCKACGARYGDTAEIPVPRVPVEPPFVLPRKPSSPGGGLTKPPRESPKPLPDPPEPPRPPDLADLIRRLSRGRHEGAKREPTTPSRARSPLGGCLGRLILVGVIFLVFIVMGVFLMVGGALRFLSGG